MKTEKGRSFILDPSDYLAKRGVPPALKPEVLSLSRDSVEAHEALKLSRALIQLNENLPIDDAIFQTGTQRTENLQEFFLALDMVKTAEGLGLSPALPCPTLLR